jgi:hypothetical protein
MMAPSDNINANIIGLNEEKNAKNASIMMVDSTQLQVARARTSGNGRTRRRIYSQEMVLPATLLCQ